MSYEELKAKIAESDRKMDEMEAVIQDKIDIEMQSKHPDRMAVLRMKEQISHIRGRAVREQDRLKKEYAMQNSPADIGDVIEAQYEVKKKGSCVREVIRMMRVERIEVAAFDEPQLTYYGTYVKKDCTTPYAKQINVPIYERDITRVVKTVRH